MWSARKWYFDVTCSIYLIHFFIFPRLKTRTADLLNSHIYIADAFVIYCTGKSLSEALLFGEHGKNMLCTEIDLNVENNFCTQHVFPMFELFIYWTCKSMNNLSYCWLVDVKIRASDKDLPVLEYQDLPKRQKDPNFLKMCQMHLNSDMQL